MKSREEYIDKMAQQLKDWSAKLDELQFKARTAGDNVRAGYEKRISDLKMRRDRVKAKLQELRETTGDTWDAVQKGVDAAWTEFKVSFSEIKEKLKKTG
jgi:chromosome segregation ATPase